MGGHNNHMNNHRIADSYLSWWTLAGVDALVGETPAGWLETVPVNDNARKGSTERAAEHIAVEPPPLPEILLKKERTADPGSEAPVIFPETWDAFQQWLAKGDNVPGLQWDDRRVLPSGAAHAKLMLITAWPDMDDQRAGALFCGEPGRLLDNMLKAIGLNRDDCYLASLAITRPAGGRCQPEDLPELERLFQHHLRLAAPQRLLLIGSDITGILTGERLPAARGRLLDLGNHLNLSDNSDNKASLPIAAVPHPTIMLSRPAQKSAAWDSLKLFSQGN